MHAPSGGFPKFRTVTVRSLVMPVPTTGSRVTSLYLKWHQIVDIFHITAVEVLASHGLCPSYFYAGVGPLGGPEIVMHHCGPIVEKHILKVFRIQNKPSLLMGSMRMGRPQGVS